MSEYQIKKLSEICLSKDEVNKCIQSGILPSDYKTKSLSDNGTSEYGKIDNDPSVFLFADFGMLDPLRKADKEFIEKGAEYIHVYALKDFLIVAFPFSKNHAFLPAERDPIVIPLSQVESFNYETEERDIYIAPAYKTVKGSAVKGAVIGGAIAGPTGALVGAIASSNTTKTVQTRAGATRKNIGKKISLTFKNRAKLSREEYSTAYWDVHYFEKNGGLQEAIDTAIDYQIHKKLIEILQDKGLTEEISAYCGEEYLVDLYSKMVKKNGIIDSSIDNSVKALKEQYDQKQEKLDAINKELEDGIRDKRRASDDYNETSILKISERKALKAKIDECEAKIHFLEERLRKEKSQHIDRIQDVIDEKAITIDDEKNVELIENEQKNEIDQKRNSEQQSKRCRTAIIRDIESMGKCQASSFFELKTGYGTFSHQMVQANLNFLAGIGRIKKFSDGETTYFASLNYREDLSRGSAADEIRKFKELLDMGAITQEEYDKKKEQLLGL